MSHHFHINIYCNNNLQTRIFSPFLERLIFLYKKKKKQFNVKFLIYRLLIKFSIIVHVHPSETIEPVIPSLFSPSWKKSHSLYPLKRERSPNSFCFTPPPSNGGLESQVFPRFDPSPYKERDDRKAK